MSEPEPDLQLAIASYSDRSSEIDAIRRVVFQDEQGVAPELEFDGRDDAATHLLAYWHGQPVGTARVSWPDPQSAKIERLAVLAAARGRGIGTQLMQQALQLAAERGARVAVVHAQAYVKVLYDILGFVQVGDRFDEAGLPHVKMTKMLTSPSPA
ncbi:putative acyltransferase [Rubidibacter lacunae KORDI 51-2]|uniref:Putative acyltransferase n=2 Tax=Rubidibacter TaxID=582491 RepID=U5DFD4_9CHRO|nr:putative acyltransferase [Rubidibacter lacunae KORDI 51-2]